MLAVHYQYPQGEQSRDQVAVGRMGDQYLLLDAFCSLKIDYFPKSIAIGDGFKILQKVRFGGDHLDLLAESGQFLCEDYEIENTAEGAWECAGCVQLGDSSTDENNKLVLPYIYSV